MSVLSCLYIAMQINQLASFGGFPETTLFETPKPLEKLRQSLDCPEK